MPGEAAALRLLPTAVSAADAKPPYPPPAQLPTQQGPKGLRFDFNDGCRVGTQPGRGKHIGKTKALVAGSFSVMPPGMHHFGWFGEETVLQFHGIGPWTVTYVNPADDPKNKPAASPPTR
jgi:hypothetical protein